MLTITVATQGHCQCQANQIYTAKQFERACANIFRIWDDTCTNLREVQYARRKIIYIRKGRGYVSLST